MKKIIAALLGAFFCLAGIAQASWTTQESGTTSEITAITFPADLTGFAVGAAGTIIRTTNAGATWVNKSSGAANYNDVLFPAPAEGYVLGPNGTLLKTVDQADTFTTVTLPADLTTADLRNGSFFGTTRALAASRGGASDSLLYLFDNAGTPLGVSTLAGLDVDGCLLSSDGAGGYTAWSWGKDNGSAQYQVRKSGTTVWTGSQAVRDIAFPSASIGYAVGDGGLVLKTTDAGVNWTAMDSGLTGRINAVAFLTEKFGWVVGAGGGVAFTANGGTAWSSYTLDAPIPDINDISAKIVSGSSVYAFVAGSGGQVLKLSSPTVTGVTPATKPAGWIGSLEVTGTGFIDGALVSLSPEGVTVINTTYVSATTLHALVWIDAGAAAGAYDLRVENPDATTKTLAGGFNVAAASGAVRLNDTWVDNNKYLPPDPLTPTVPRFTIRVQPRISFEVHSDFGVSPAKLNAVALTRYGSPEPLYIFSQIPASAVTQVTTADVRVNYKLLEVLPTGEVVAFTLYAEDDAGNAGLETMLAVVAAPTGDTTYEAPAGSTPGTEGVFLPKKSTWDPETSPAMPAEIVFKPGIAVDRFTVRLVDRFGRKIYEKRVTEDMTASGVVRSQTVTAKGVVTKYNFDITRLELPPQLNSGVVLCTVTEGNKLYAKNLLMIAPASMK